MGIYTQSCRAASRRVRTRRGVARDESREDKEEYKNRFVEVAELDWRLLSLDVLLSLYSLRRKGGVRTGR